MRRREASAVRASPTAQKAGPDFLLTALVATLTGAFLSFVGALGSGDMPLAPRTVYMIALAWVGAALGVGAYRLAERFAFIRGRWWLAAILGGVMMAAPMGLIVWAGNFLVEPEDAQLAYLPGYVAVSLVVSVAMSLMGVAIGHGAAARREAGAAAQQAPPKFLERLPLKLRGAEVWAVEAEDHYLRLHTSKGQDLILMRLADAVAELEGVEGAQVHRSWWVARDAIAEAERGDGRAILTLKDGGKVPVSRTYAKIIRDRGWI